MASKISKKGIELLQFCSKKHIEVQFIPDYENNKNTYEYVTEDDKPIVRITVGNVDDPNILSEYTEFIKKLKDSF